MVHDVSESDRDRWNRRYAERGVASAGRHGPPPAFADIANVFPTGGTALEPACGRGRAAVWLVRRGMDVWGVDVSPVAVALAARLAAAEGVADRCRFEVWDLDHGLPPGPPVDLVLCHRFYDPRLDPQLLRRLAPGGLLAVAVLSEVGADPGPFRAPPGALRHAFGHLDVVTEGEQDGEAWIVAHRG